MVIHIMFIFDFYLRPGRGVRRRVTDIFAHHHYERAEKTQRALGSGEKCPGVIATLGLLGVFLSAAVGP